jgi:hypothetical protein
VYVEDRKKLEQKNDFLNFLCQESENCTWQRNSLPRASLLALGKEIFASVFSVRRAFCLALGKEACLPSVFFCAESQIKISRRRCIFISFSYVEY